MQIVKGVGILVILALLAIGCRERREATAPPNTPESALEKGVELLKGGGGEKAPKDPVPPPTEENGEEPEVPEIPVAAPVPDKPGFVISPYNGKWIDVTGVKPGTVMADPHFTEEKKFFRVPEIPVQPEVAPVEEPAAGETPQEEPEAEPADGEKTEV